MSGRITYTVTQASTPAMSPFDALNVFALNNVFATTLNVGDTADINVHWGYSARDPYYKDTRNVAQASSGLVEVAWFLTVQAFKFTLPNVVEDRTAQVNEYAVLNALNQELAVGTVIAWYPDYTNYPAEYFQCVANQRMEPRRNPTIMNLWDFSFDLMVLPTVQFPSAVPPFQMA